MLRTTTSVTVFSTTYTTVVHANTVTAKAVLSIVPSQNPLHHLLVRQSACLILELLSQLRSFPLATSHQNLVDQMWPLQVSQVGGDCPIRQSQCLKPANRCADWHWHQCID